MRDWPPTPFGILKKCPYNPSLLFQLTWSLVACYFQLSITPSTMPSKKSDEGARKELSGLTEPVALSAQLAAIVGVDDEGEGWEAQKESLKKSRIFFVFCLRFCSSVFLENGSCTVCTLIIWQLSIYPTVHR